MLPSMTDEEVLIHIKDMANVNYKATDIVVKRFKQIQQLIDLCHSNTAEIYFRSKVEDILEVHHD